MSNRPKLIRTKLPLSVAAVKAENERRARIVDEQGEEGAEFLGVSKDPLPTDRRSRRAMRRRVPLASLLHVHSASCTKDDGSKG